MYLIYMFKHQKQKKKNKYTTLCRNNLLKARFPYLCFGLLDDVDYQLLIRYSSKERTY